MTDDRYLDDTLPDTTGLGYEPLVEAWICDAHGEPECNQGDCAKLPWPEPNSSPLLAEFMEWADAKFRQIIRPYDLSDDPDKEMPDEAFDAYWPDQWLSERGN